jgi:putative permease
VFDLNYAALLAFLVGLSVIIPYLGIAVITVPVVVIALMQFGFDGSFWSLMAGYILIQALDGMLLVPLLFSEANDIHPLAIIIAVLVFGAWFGVAGVFFAIPLAIFIKAMIEAWPRLGTPSSAEKT